MGCPSGVLSAESEMRLIMGRGSGPESAGFARAMPALRGASGLVSANEALHSKGGEGVASLRPRGIATG